ncbi:MAG: alpha/beta fold hydrolase [Chloroflexi bacterium]|nr:alpha/beta fold hydrolase [Chloroflexota bacterium]
MHAVLPDGLRLYYESHGQGLPVVFVHGLSCTHAMWKCQAPALAERFRMIALDLRGHGQSDKPPGPYSVPMFAQDVLRLLDHLEIERAVLVGLSMGGGTVQNFALMYPRRLQALGLISTSSEHLPAVRQRFYEWAEAAERGGMAPLAESLVASWIAPQFREKNPEEFEQNVRTTAANDPGAFAASARANAVRNWTDQLHRITCPTLFVGGELDPAGAVRNAEIFRRHISNLEAHLIPGVSHMVPIEAPEQFNQILLGFLERVAAP